MSGVFFEEADKVRDVFIAQLPGDFIDEVRGGEKLAFGFENDVVIDEGRTGFANR